MYWSVCRLRPHKEPTAVRWLGMKGYVVYLPRIRDFRIRQGRRIECRPALFPGYLFVLIESRWYSVGSTPGVIGLLRDELGPVKVSDRIIDEIRQRERNGLIELPRREEFQIGDQVRILQGPFAGHLALYAGMKPRERVEILLQLLGSEQRVELPRVDIEVARS